jgi:hypothetical protein
MLAEFDSMIRYTASAQSGCARPSLRLAYSGQLTDLGPGQPGNQKS